MATTPAATVIHHSEAREEFRQAILDAGLILKSDPIMNGAFQRVPVEGSRSSGNKSGSYIGHLDDYPAGKVFNYKTGEVVSWKASTPTKHLSPEEREERRRLIDEAQLEEAAERRKRETDVAGWCELQWNSAPPAPADHPYLVRKGIEPGRLRVDVKGNLMVPMHDAGGKLWSLQKIGLKGEKHFTKNGRVLGTNVLLGQIEFDKPLLVVEGYATGVSVHRATQLPVAVAFNSGNLLAVAQAYRDKDPFVRIVFAADNDHHLTEQGNLNTGIEKAMDAALTIDEKHADISVLVPHFEPGTPGSDWNDYELQHGREAMGGEFSQMLSRLREEGLQVEGLWNGIEEVPAFEQVAVEQPVERVAERSLPQESQAEREQQLGVAGRDRALAVVQGLPGDSEENQRMLAAAFRDLESNLKCGDTLADVWDKAALYVQMEVKEREARQETQQTREPIELPEFGRVNISNVQLPNGGLGRLERRCYFVLSPEPEGAVKATLHKRSYIYDGEKLATTRDITDGPHKPHDYCTFRTEAAAREFTDKFVRDYYNQSEQYEAPLLREKFKRLQVEEALANRLTLKDKDLSGLDLSGLTFRNMDVSGSNFSKSTMRGTTFDNCFALGSDFSEARFENAVIRDVNAAGSIWARAHLANTSISNCGFDHALLHDVVFERQTQQQEKAPETPAARLKNRMERPLLETITLAESLRQDGRAISDLTKRAWNSVTRIFHAPEPVRAPRSAAAPTQPAVMPEISHNSFRHADLSGARFVGVNMHHNVFDGAILRGAVGLGDIQDVTTHLQRDTDRAKEIGNLRAEALQRVGCFDQNVKPDAREKLTAALDEQLRSIDPKQELTPRAAVDKAVAQVLAANEPERGKELDRNKEKERARPRTAARTSR